MNDNSNPIDFPFYDFLKSEAKTEEQIKETMYYKWYVIRLKKGIPRVRRTGEIRNEEDVIICLKDLSALNEVVQKDPLYKEIPRVIAFINSDGSFCIVDGCHRAICSIHYNDNHDENILIPVEIIDYKK